MTRYWGVGLGEGGKYVPHGLKGGYFAIGSGDLLGDVSWLKEGDWDHVRKAYREKYPDTRQPQSGFGAGLVYRLVVEVKEGDIILLRNSQESCINIGVVGPYYYDITPSDGCPYRHRRRVAWGKMILREKMSHNLKTSLGVPATIIDLSRYADEINRLRQEAGAVPPPPPPSLPVQGSKTAASLQETVTKSKHEELVDRVKEMGRKLNWLVDKSESGVPYQHDCLWRAKSHLNPKVVWEISMTTQDKDITSLNWACGSDGWPGSVGIMVVETNADRGRVIKRAGHQKTFDILTADELDKLHGLILAGHGPLLPELLNQ